MIIRVEEQSAEGSDITFSFSTDTKEIMVTLRDLECYVLAAKFSKEKWERFLREVFRAAETISPDFLEEPQLPKPQKGYIA